MKIENIKKAEDLFKEKDYLEGALTELRKHLNNDGLKEGLVKTKSTEIVFSSGWSNIEDFYIKDIAISETFLTLAKAHLEKELIRVNKEIEKL